MRNYARFAMAPYFFIFSCTLLSPCAGAALLVGGREKGAKDGDCPVVDKKDGTKLYCNKKEGYIYMWNRRRRVKCTSCSQDECCDKSAECPEQCSEPRLYVPKEERKVDKKCGAKTCNDDLCCDKKAQCQYFTCEPTQGWMRNPKVKPEATCKGTKCKPEECCERTASCADWSGTCNAPQVKNVYAHCPKKDPSSCKSMFCCHTPPTCARFKGCGYSRTRDPAMATKVCEKAKCTDKQCCRDMPTCKSFKGCGDSNKVLNLDKMHKQCLDGAVSVKDYPKCSVDLCCQEAHKCSASLCTGDHSFDESKKDKHCPNGKCTQAFCCQDDSGDCASFKECGKDQMVDPAKAISKCVGGKCTADFCCKAAPLCSTFSACGDDHLPDPTKMQEACSEGICTIAQCCKGAVQCHSFTGCPSGEILDPAKKDETCRGGKCSTNLCCTIPPKCSSFFSTCGADLIDANKGGTLCTGGVCTADQCCKATPTCKSFSACAQNTVPIAEPDKVFCTGGECTSGLCCAAAPKCRSFTCGAHALLDQDKADDFCTTGTCTVDLCCEKEPVCLHFEGCPQNEVVDPSKASKECHAHTCVPEMCCMEAPKCSTMTQCGDGHVQDHTKTQKFCAAAKCTQDECCKENPSCGEFTGCGGTRVLDESKAQHKCAGENCFPEECCKDAPKCGADFDACGDKMIPDASKENTFCTSDPCTTDFCCMKGHPHTTCKGFTVCGDTADPDPDKEDETCPNGKCDASFCCKDQESPVAEAAGHGPLFGMSGGAAHASAPAAGDVTAGGASAPLVGPNGEPMVPGTVPGVGGAVAGAIVGENTPAVPKVLALNVKITVGNVNYKELVMDNGLRNAFELVVKAEVAGAAAHGTSVNDIALTLSAASESGVVISAIISPKAGLAADVSLINPTALGEGVTTSLRNLAGITSVVPANKASSISASVTSVAPVQTNAGTTGAATGANWEVPRSGNERYDANGDVVFGSSHSSGADSEESDHEGEAKKAHEEHTVENDHEQGGTAPSPATPNPDGSGRRRMAPKRPASLADMSQTAPSTAGTSAVMRRERHQYA